jgi:hypothetical protein
MSRIFAVLLMTASFAAAGPKKLIEFGWDEPDTAFMRQHIEEMEKRPFDGTVFEIAAGKVRFINEAWGTHKFTEAELAQSLDDIKATTFRRFTENFLRFDVTPGDVDWFDDFSAIVENARIAAKIAKAGKARGVLFDCEAYAKPVWDYRKQRDNKTKTFDQYAAQTRARGREFMRAMRHEYPQITIFLTFGYTLPLVQTAGDKSKLAAVDYGLYPAFLDGMLDEAGNEARIIDGYELSSAYQNAIDFDDGVKNMHTGALPFAADPDKYRAHVRAGFGIWMDQDWRKHGWGTKDFSKNFFTPEVFENSVRMALERTDEYVWIYTEKPWWWKAPDGKPVDLPPAYEDALRRAAGGTR